MSMNMEWFWDEKLPHDGQIAFGAVGYPPNRPEVELEARVIGQIIIYNRLDIVGLVEVEGCSVVERILAYLPRGWNPGFKKGRDGT